MKLFKCPECDNFMHKIDDEGVYQCKNCLKCWFKDGDNFYEEEFFDEAEDDMDEGCIACGCNLYPDCKESCPLFDDD